MKLMNKRWLSVILFLVGVTVGILFNAGVVWAQFEASLWDESPTDDKSLHGFHCPLLITSNETGLVRVDYKNTLDRPINPVIRTRISKGQVILQREESERPEILPGETAHLEYSVTGSDAAWDRFILVRVYAFPQYSLPSRGGSCGILVLNLPFLNGTLVVILAVIFSVGGMGGGIWMWRRVNFPLNDRSYNALRAMIFLAAIILLGLILELLKIWGLATVVLIFTFIMMAGVMGYFLAAS